MKEFLARCAEAVLVGDKDGAAQLAKETLVGGHEVLAVVENGFTAGVRAAGAKWEQGAYFLPELAFAAEAMKAAMAILQPELAKDGGGNMKARVLIGTVQGDIHDIGKSLVTTLMLASNYEVIDLGADVPHKRFLDEVERLRPDFLGMSALLTTTMSGQGEVIRLLEQRGLRDSVKVLVGGAPTTADWAREIGADGHGGDAVAAVAALDALL
jgi:trimethylamine corrinoid protein